MPVSPYKFEGYPGSYKVFRRREGQFLGTVEYREQHYNLRRPFTNRYWVARDPSRRVVAPEHVDPSRGGWNTRADAAAALDN